MSVLKFTLLILVVPGGLYRLDRLALRAQRQGWLFWRRSKPTEWPA